MSTLKDKLKKLSFFTHYPKEHESITYNNVIEEYPSKEEKWDEWFNVKYVNGNLYINLGYDDIIDQHRLSNSSQKVGIYLYNSGIGYFIVWTNWQPYNLLSEQGFGGLTYDTSQSLYYSSYGSYVSGTSGTKTLTFPSYVKNNILYTGVKYKVNYSNLTTSIQYFDIEILDEETE